MTSRPKVDYVPLARPYPKELTGSGKGHRPNNWPPGPVGQVQTNCTPSQLSDEDFDTPTANALAIGEGIGAGP